MNDKNIVIKFNYKVNYDDIKTIKDRIKKSIYQHSINVDSVINKSNITGYYYMKNYKYNIYMLRDMLLNNNFINKYIITNNLILQVNNS